MSEEFWKGEFGDEYLKRNRVSWDMRIPFWRSVVPSDVRSVLEVGCNAGWNLLALRTTGLRDLCGIEINDRARDEANGAGFIVGNKSAQNLDLIDAFDLVFTAGVLIHIPPEDLPQVMQNIVNASKRYVLAIEYAHPEETEVEYRGHTGKLWKRPFGRLYQAMGLKLLKFGLLTADDGFDNCAYWLLEKQ